MFSVFAVTHGVSDVLSVYNAMSLFMDPTAIEASWFTSVGVGFTLASK